MFRPRQQTNDSGTVVTIVMVVLVVGGVLGWAIYESQEPVPVRQVPTETINVPPSGTK